MKPSHVCTHLRTKKMYIPEQAAQVFAEENGAFTDTAHCWCNRTLAEVGPDQKQVALQICGRARACFEE
ncbi:MAG TPA: hypothetical protein VFD66_03940 [Verrucomicrobiae bacterium]|nr:hypothetical protein [Verrucomicrobiae bacterium]